MYDEDRVVLLVIAEQGLGRFDAQMLVNRLMGKHDHFVLHARGANLLLLMCHIYGVYGQRYNWRHGKHHAEQTAVATPSEPGPCCCRGPFLLGP